MFSKQTVNVSKDYNFETEPFDRILLITELLGKASYFCVFSVVK